jgi:hypothetical protein
LGSSKAAGSAACTRRALTPRAAAQVLNGLLTVFHTERSTDLSQQVNVQNSLPVLSSYDKESLQVGMQRRAELDAGCSASGCLPASARCCMLTTSSMVADAVPAHLQIIAKEFEIDFISLSYTRTGAPAAAPPPAQFQQLTCVLPA